LQTGTAWGYTACVNAAPSTTLAFQPWQRASLLGQDYNNKALIPFQNQPNPFSSAACDPKRPATPHSNAMMVLLGDASVRSVVPSISITTWNSACLPNDGGILGSDW